LFNSHYLKNLLAKEVELREREWLSLSRSAESLALPQSALTSAFGVTWALRTRDLFKLPLLLFLLSFCFSFVIHSTEFNRGI